MLDSISNSNDEFPKEVTWMHSNIQWLNIQATKTRSVHLYHCPTPHTPHDDCWNSTKL